MNGLKVAFLLTFLLSSAICDEENPDLSEDLTDLNKTFPTAHLLDPPSRYEAFTTTARAGCVSRSHSSHYMSDIPSDNMVMIDVDYPSAEGYCMIQLITPGNSQYAPITLIPHQTETDSEGKFECGREYGLDAFVVTFPEKTHCTECVLAVKWYTEEGIYWDCSDVLLNADDAATCDGSCINGGHCQNGSCICPNGYTGNDCEIYAPDPTRILATIAWVFVVVVLGIVLAALAFKLYQKRKLLLASSHNAFRPDSDSKFANVEDMKKEISPNKKRTDIDTSMSREIKGF